MIYTYSSSGVFVRTPSLSGKFPVKKIVPVSTIGAGDNFNAGMIAALYRKKIFLQGIETIQKNDWEEIIGMAVDFASHVCMSYENYISREFAKEI